MLKRMSKFLTSLFTALFISYTCMTSAFAYDNSYTLYAVPNAHLDAAWNWTIPTTISDYLYNTWNLENSMIDSNPGYKFNGSAAQYYAWLQEYYPSLYNNVKAKVAAGTWKPGGAAWVQHDTIIPSGESMVRQYLIGQKYFKTNFGSYCDNGFLPDDFGISWNLPQILKKAGVNSFMGTRITAVNDDIFNWQGVDGTNIFTFRPHYMYFDGNSIDAGKVTTSLSYSANMGIKKGMFLLGRGDTGGGPDQNLINSAKALNSGTTPVIAFKSTSDLYNDLTTAEKNSAPVRNQELLLKSTQGCYTNQAEIKKYNRIFEVTAEEAEKFDSMAMWLGAASNPSYKLDTAWKKKLVNDFHDIVPGTSIHQVNVDAWNDYEIGLNLVRSGLDNSLAGIADRADTTGTGTVAVPVVVSNPLAFQRSDVVETTVTFSSVPTAVRVYDSNNNEIPSQATINGNSAKVVFIATNVPSVGYSVFRVVSTATAGSYNTGLSIGSNAMDSSKYRVEINPTNGNISRIYDKTGAREVLAAGTEVELQRLDDQDQAWDITYACISGTPTKINTTPTITILESGPVRVVYQITKTYGTSTYTQKVTLYSSSDRIDIPTTVDWQEGAKLLKVAFTLRASNPLATFDLSYGAVARGNDNLQQNAWNDTSDRSQTTAPYMYENPGHMWGDLTNSANDYGVSIFNNCKYGWDKPSDNQIRLTLLRSARQQDALSDKGLNSFTYSIYSHSGDWKTASTPAMAEQQNYPLLAYPTTSHTGALGKSFSFASVNQSNIAITAIKKMEDPASNDLIIRLSETQGKASTPVSVAFGGNINSASETNLLEDYLASASYSGNSLSTTLGKYEIKTFRISIANTVSNMNTKPTVANVNLNSYYNIDGMSYDTNRGNGSADFTGGTYSADLMPAQITSEDVTFNIGPKADNSLNLVKALGQSITLPTGNYKYLYLLGAAAGGGASSGNYSVNYTTGAPTTKSITFADWTSSIGGFNMPVLGDKIGYVFTHEHSAGGDIVAKNNFVFVYKIPVDTSRTVSSIQLPNVATVKIMAMSLTSGGFTNEVSPENGTGSQVGTGTTVNLTSSFNQDGFSFDNNKGDGNYDNDTTTSKYPADGLSTSFVSNGTSYILGSLADGSNNAIRAAGQTITLNQGSYSAIKLLGSATMGDQSNVGFRFNYSDGTNSTQTIATYKDWCPASTVGQTVAVGMNHRHYGTTDQTLSCNIFEYTLTPTSGKTVQSITFPSNTNVHVLALTLIPASVQQTQVNLSSSFNQDGFSYDSNKGDGNYDNDTTTSKYPADGISSTLTNNGTTYNMGPMSDGSQNAIKGIGQTIALTQAGYSAIKMLGSATMGDQSNVNFIINYTDGTNSTQIIATYKDWCPSSTAGQTVVYSIGHRHYGTNDQTVTSCNIFEYVLTPTSGKTVQSITMPSNTNVHVLAITLVP